MHVVVVRPTPILIVLGKSGLDKLMLIDALANHIVNESLKSTITLNGRVLELTFVATEHHLNLFLASR